MHPAPRRGDRNPNTVRHRRGDHNSCATVVATDILAPRSAGSGDDKART